jgi:lipopolysaccharide transport protein LptA
MAIGMGVSGHLQTSLSVAANKQTQKDTEVQKVEKSEKPVTQDDGTESPNEEPNGSEIQKGDISKPPESSSSEDPQSKETPPVVTNIQEPDKSEKSDSKLRDKIKKQGGPTEITADQLEIDQTNHTAIYTGNVVVTQDQTSIYAQKLTAYADEDNKLKKAVAVGDCRLVRENITATGDLCTFYDAEQKLEVEGRAKAWQQEDTLAANRLVAYLERDVVEAYSDNKPERAIMTLHPKKGTEQKTSDDKPRKVSDTSDQSGKKSSPLKRGLQGNVPIVITCDTIVLDNVKRTATYTGNVVAVKTPTELKAQRMVAYAQPENDELSKIEVFDGVHITKENLIFTGDKGVYFDDTQTATLEGVSGNKARVVDKVKKSTAEAPLIQAFLATNKFLLKGQPATTTTSRGRIRSTFQRDSDSEANANPKSEKKSTEKKSEDEVESPINTTLYPGGQSQ